MRDGLTLSTRGEAGCAVLTVGGEIDLATAPDLAAAARSALDEISSALVIDLSEVTFLDSTGLKVLLTVQKQAQSAGGGLALAGVAGPVEKVIVVTGLTEIFTICPDVLTAVATGVAAPTGAETSPIAE